MKTIIALALLAAVAAADQDTFEVPWDGAHPDTFITEKFLKEWKYNPRCGIDKDTWESLRGKLRLHDFRALSMHATRATFVYDGDLPSDLIEGVMRARYLEWRPVRINVLKTAIVRANGERQKAARALDDAKKALTAAAGDEDVVFDRAAAVRSLSDRFVELQSRIADARIEHAVVRARARAVATLIERRKYEERKRRAARLEALRKRLSKLSRDLHGDHPRVTKLIECIDREELIDLEPSEAPPELARLLIDFEIEQIAQEERLKMIEQALADVRRRRVALFDRQDLKSLQARIERLMAELASDSAKRLQATIARLNNSTPRRR